MIDINNYMYVDEALISRVRESYGKSENDIEQDLDIIYEWWKKQPHLPFLKDDSSIERILMRNKFSVEKTKKKLDAYFTLKGLSPEFFNPKCLDINSPKMQKMHKSYYLMPLKLSNNNERIIIFKVKNPDPALFDFNFFFTYAFLVMELMNRHDYCSAVRIFLDTKDFTFAMFTKMHANTLIKGLKLFQEGYSCRVAGLEYIHAPSFIDVIAKFLSLALKDSKININNNVEELYQNISQECLPEEYGGKAGKLDDIQDAWFKIIDENQDFIKSRIAMVSNEKLRVGKSPYSEVFGVEGTFKKINID